MWRRITRSVAWTLSFALLTPLAVMFGCDKGGASTTSQSVTAANEWVVDAIPNAVSITEVAEALAPPAEEDSEDASADTAAVETTHESAASPAPFTLVGKIDSGGPFETFDPSQATFLMMELPDPSHATDDPDHADNCPFCKRRALNAPKAMVRFLDDSGEPIVSSASTLVGVQAGDTVTVQGTATFEPTLNLVTIDAEKIAID
ncbi:MAG: hypothetical protein AAGD07_06035 [Planctomycetota bacterium]